MIFKGIKRKSAQKYVSKHLKIQRLSNDGKIKDIAVLVDASIYGEFPFLSQIGGVFNIDPNSIEVFYYTTDKNLAKKFPEKMFTDTDLGFSSTIKNQALTRFLNKPFDGLFCYFNQDKLMLNLATVKSKARFKIGFSGVNEYLCDFSVGTDLHNIKEFTFELKKYLTILKKI